jgi:cytochrome c oxidase cbb3-type subunit 2
MFNFHKDHKKLVIVSLSVFVILSIFIAIVPASNLQYVEPFPTDEALTQTERAGLNVYVAENCVACHTQQVRGIEMDETWGDRPSIPSDYYYSKKRLDVWRQSPSLLGSERTGPDLTNIGKRQPGQSWHLLHLYNPRSVVNASIMPSYPWMFEEKDSTAIIEKDVVVPVPKDFFNKPGQKIVAGPKALQLVAYLQSLKQPEMPGNETVEFIPSLKDDLDLAEEARKGGGVDGEKLFMNTCAACHQQTGKGLVGAFPPLAGSSIVNDEDPELMIQIILQGYDARSDYGVMPPFASQLNDAEVAAAANHARSSWGNDASEITAEDVKKVRDYVMELNQ